MLTAEDKKEINDMMATWDNPTLANKIALFTYAETLNPDLWKDALGADYNPATVTEFKNIMWTEATKRGITVAQVQAEIQKISKETTEANIQALKDDIAFEKAMAKEKAKKQTNEFFKNLFILMIVFGILYLGYLGVNGRLGGATASQ